MTWTIKDGYYGCGKCAFCKGIEMDDRTAIDVDQTAECIREVVEICPSGIIQEI